MEPAVLEWAIKRSRREEYLFSKYARLGEWLSGDVQPTWKQLRAFAKDAYAGEGSMYLREPPIESTPIPDFRTVGDTVVDEISPNLRDTIYICQRRQDWYSRFAAANGHPHLDFVGTAESSDRAEEVAATIREKLGWTSEIRRNSEDLYAYRKSIVGLAEDAGILVMVNGIVGDNTHRPLDWNEFRGLALHDEFAPLVFVNAVDALGAQIFTLGHEIAHIWRGQSGLSDSDSLPTSSNNDESWCNDVAVELVVPRVEFEATVDRRRPPLAQTRILSTEFKTSDRAILRRFLRMDMLGTNAYVTAYREQVSGAKSLNSGGNYRHTKPLRVSRRFARALLSETFAMNTTYAEAFGLLEIKNGATFHNFARVMGF